MKKPNMLRVSGSLLVMRQPRILVHLTLPTKIFGGQIPSDTQPVAVSAAMAETGLSTAAPSRPGTLFQQSADFCCDGGCFRVNSAEKEGPSQQFS